jgi:hypothetical protein
MVYLIHALEALDLSQKADKSPILIFFLKENMGQQRDCHPQENMAVLSNYLPIS